MSAHVERKYYARPIPRGGYRETVRMRIVDLIIVFYWLLVLEGALRKWGLPQLHQVMFFIRVPVVFACYWLALQNGRWPRTSIPIFSCYLIGISATILVPLQLIAGSYGQPYIILAGYGWLNYFFYIPLAFIIADHFQAKDIERLTRHAAWLAVASAPLVVLQFFSPPGSVLNSGSGLDDSDRFASVGAALGYVRPSGLFTSTAGLAHFLASTTALLIAALLAKNGTQNKKPYLMWMGIGAIAVMTAFSQSRTVFFMLALVLIATALAGIVANRRKVLLRSVILPIALVAALAVLWPLAFPESFSAFSERWNRAMDNESSTFEFGVFGRAFYAFYGFSYHLADTPLIGYLLGLGTNAARQLNWVEMPTAALEWQGYGAWAEDGWSRHIIELGPLLGIGYIGLRLFLTLWLASHAARTARRFGNITAAVLFGYVGIVLLIGQITGQGTINGFVWFFTGVCAAAARMSALSSTRLTSTSSAPKIFSRKVGAHVR